MILAEVRTSKGNRGVYMVIAKAIWPIQNLLELQMMRFDSSATFIYKGVGSAYAGRQKRLHPRGGITGLVSQLGSAAGTHICCNL